MTAPEKIAGTPTRKEAMLKLGLVMLPVNVHQAISGTGEKEVALKMVCTGHSDGSNAHGPVPVNQVYRCNTCTNEERASFGKGKQVAGGYVVVPEDELAALTGIDESLNKELNVTCHPVQDVMGSTIEAGSVYLLDPGNARIRQSYALVMRMIENRPDLAYCVEWAPRTKPAWFRLVVMDGIIAMRQFARPEDVKAHPVIEDEPDPMWLTMADQFVETLTMPFDPATFSDNRRVALGEFIAAQEAIAAGEQPTPSAAKAAAPKAPGMDLAALLQAQIDASQAAKAPAKKAPAKRKAKAAA